VKEQIAQALQTTAGVSSVETEHHFGPVQADVSFCLRGKRGAVEVQLSDKPRAEIDFRTRRYHELGVHVIWVLREERTICEGGRLVVYDWEEYLHALYFGVVYHWAGGQLLQPLYLERRRNLNRRYFDKKRDRWASPYYEQIRTPWFLDTICITDLSPEVRLPGQFGQYTLPAAHLWCLPYEAQKKNTLLNDWRWGVFNPPVVE
jgi:hypothetical protein